MCSQQQWYSRLREKKTTKLEGENFYGWFLEDWQSFFITLYIKIQRRSFFCFFKSWFEYFSSSSTKKKFKSSYQVMTMNKLSGNVNLMFINHFQGHFENVIGKLSFTLWLRSFPRDKCHQFDYLCCVVRKRQNLENSLANDKIDYDMWTLR